MKRTIGALVAVAALGSVAFGATTANAYNWKGCYAGVQGGWARGDSQIFTDAAAPPIKAFTNGIDARGGLIGGTFGCQTTMFGFLLGVEGDLASANKHGGAIDILAPGFTFEVRENWLGTFRGRLGWTMGGLLLYGTAGLAVADVTLSETNTTLGVTGSEHRSRDGFVWGGGVEWAFAPGSPWSVKGEYLHLDFQNLGYFNPAPVAGVGFTPKSNVALDNNIFRLGINFKMPPF